MPADLRLSLKSLRAFVAAVDHGSIAGAAQALNVAPSAVAASVDQVEAEMGAALLVRARSRGVSPTPEGRKLAARFRALLDDYTECLQSGREAASGLSGALRLGYYAPVAPAFLPRILVPLMAEHPALRLDLREYDNESVQEALLTGQIDLAICADTDIGPGLVARHLLDLPPYLLVPDGHPLCRAERVTLAEVARHPLVQLDRPLSRPYNEALFAQRGHTPTVMARANATEMVRSLVGAGLGVAVLNMRPATAQSYAGDRLRALPLEPGLPGLALVCVRPDTRPRRLVALAEAALTDWMTGPQAHALVLA